MKQIKVFLACSLIVVMAGCSKNPKACFTVEVQGHDGKWKQTTTGNVGERFYFSPMCSKNIFVGTEFDYGDGTSGTQEGHEYTKPGTYTVKCTVFSGKNGKQGDLTDVTTQSVTVKALQADVGILASSKNN